MIWLTLRDTLRWLGAGGMLARGGLTLGLVLLSVIGAATAAHAQDAKVVQSKASFKAGAAAYEMGDYLAAIQALEAAYGLTPLPAIAFSLAQAERRQYLIAHDAAHLERAITLFRSYLREVPSGGRRADALDALGQLEPLAGGSVPAAAPIAEPERAAQTRLLVSCDAPRARVALDGAATVAAPLIAEVQPGKHKLQLQAPGFFPYEREVEAIAGALVPIDVALREQPASVTLSATPEANVQIDGAFVGSVAEPRRLSLASGEHVFTFGKNGHRLQTLDVQLEPGATRAFSASLQPTVQRTTSLVLFGVAGASLIGGAIFAALALDRESDAHALLQRRTMQNISSDELHDYEDTRRDRNRLRVVAGAGFVGAAACLLTGLVLYLFDPPETPQR